MIITVFLLLSAKSGLFSLFLAWQFDIWKFSTKPFNSTKVLVSGWNVITEYNPDIDTACYFPAGGSKGKFRLHGGQLPEE